jgi:hypothetical protein
MQKHSLFSTSIEMGTKDLAVFDAVIGGVEKSCEGKFYIAQPCFNATLDPAIELNIYVCVGKLVEPTYVQRRRWGGPHGALFSLR